MRITLAVFEGVGYIPDEKERLKMHSLQGGSGFPTGVEHGGGVFKIWWGGLKSIHGGAWGALNAV